MQRYITIGIIFICASWPISCINTPGYQKVDNSGKPISEPSVLEAQILIDKGASPLGGETSLNKIDLAEMVYIQAGEFIMGSYEMEHHHHEHGMTADQGHHKHKDVDFGMPDHKVFLDAYYIDKYEVTNARYSKFIEAGGYSNPEYWTEDGWQWRLKNNIIEPNWWSVEDARIYKSGPDYPDHPVTGISWYEAMAYARWAGKSLATEAQWEKAARGASGDRLYPWGDADPDCSFANFCLEKFKLCQDSTSVVGKYENGRSPYGVYDMAGNVCEWCRDWYSRDYYANSPYNNPQGPETGAMRVLRGGSWLNIRDFIRSTFRLKAEPGLRTYFNGFRCVVETTSNR